MRLPGLACAALAATALAVPAAGPPAALPAAPRLEAFLRERLGLDTGQVAAVRQGRPIARALASSVDHEIQVGGAVHIDAPAGRLTALVQDVERLETGQGFLQTRRLSDPPRIEDFAQLQLPAGDIAALRTCRPGNCDVKLGQGAFVLLATIDWTAPDVVDRLNELARRTALSYVNAYRAGGNAELAVYIDSERPQIIAAELAGLLARARIWPDTLAPLTTHLLGYPSVPAPAGTHEFFYWSMADFGLKPVLRLNHVVSFVPEPPAVPTSVVIVKQLYASHYFQAALEVRAVVADEAHSGAGATLVIVNLARSDGLTGLFGGLVKSKARSRAREGLERALAAIRQMAESAAPPS